MGFREIEDQAVAIRLLRSMLRRGRVPNALLFWGPDGVGKRMAALELAKAVNCTAGEADACGSCLSCRKVVKGNHPDVKVVAPVKRSRIINVDAIEWLVEFASLRAFESPWRVFMLLDADRIGLPAQNHFLKTLEEPPGRSLFILVTEYPGLLLPTIRSRCQMVRFNRLRPETIVRLLRGERDITPEAAEAVARLSEGQMSRALDLVESGKREVVLDLTRRLAAGEDPVALSEAFCAGLKTQRSQEESDEELPTGYEAPAHDMTREDRDWLKEARLAMEEAAKQRDRLEYLYLLQTWYRDALVLGETGDAARVLNQDRLADLEQAASSMAVGKLAAIDRARLYLERFIKDDRVFRDLFFALAE